jgi:hypothetical protein
MSRSRNTCGIRATDFAEPSLLSRTTVVCSDGKDFLHKLCSN